MPTLTRRAFFTNAFAFAAACATRSRAQTPAPAPLEDNSFTAACDNSIQRYILIRPEGRPRDALVALHGHGSDRRQFATDSRDECRAARDFAARHAMLFVSPDYRAPTSWMGPKAEADLVQLIDILLRDEAIRRVFLCGGSMGGASTLTFAVLHPELLAGIAAMNGTANHVEYANFQDAIAESFGGAKESLPDEYRKRSAEFSPERLTMPVALTAGGQDDLVPPDSILRLEKALKALDRDVLLLYREDGGHSTTYDDATAALDFILSKAPA